MKYLFFDIECADGLKAICEYGYVVTDVNFNILEKQNILINPEAEFNLTGRKNRPDLVLAYPHELYYMQPSFEYYYQTIKELMKQDDLVIFGYAVESDIIFLAESIKRYNLHLFDYISYDIQNLVSVLNNYGANRPSLEKVFNDLLNSEAEVNWHDHKACDDAHKSMLVLKELTIKQNLNSIELLNLYPDLKYKTLDYLKHREQILELRKEIRKKEQIAKRSRREERKEEFDQFWETTLKLSKEGGLENINISEESLQDIFKAINYYEIIKLNKKPNDKNQNQKTAQKDATKPFEEIWEAALNLAKS